MKYTISSLVAKYKATHRISQSSILRDVEAGKLQYSDKPVSTGRKGWHYVFTQEAVDAYLATKPKDIIYNGVTYKNLSAMMKALGVDARKARKLLAQAEAE